MRLFTLRGPVWRVPWPLTLLAWAARGLWAGLRWLAAHGIASAVLIVAGALWWVVAAGGALWLIMAVGAALMTAGVAGEMNAKWWRRMTDDLASWRRRRELDALWEDAMDGTGLSRPQAVPTLASHHWGGNRDTEVLLVHMLPGQLVADWRERQTRLAAAFGLQRVRCQPVFGSPGDVRLFCRPFARLTPGVTSQRVELHPTVQPTVQEELSTDGDEPVDGIPDEIPAPRGGAFPRTPKGRDR